MLYTASPWLMPGGVFL